MLVRKGLLLDGAVFHERAHIEVSAAALCCRRTRFPAGVNLRVRWAQVVLDDADLAAPSILTGVPPFPDLNEGRWARALERLLPEPRFKPELRSRPRLLSLRRTDVAGLPWPASTCAPVGSPAPTTSTSSASGRRPPSATPQGAGGGPPA